MQEEPVGMIFGFTIAFLLTAALTVAGSVAAALLKNRVHCALSLTITFAGLALLYLQLDAQFAGFSQILVYIGAVAILVVFAILLTRASGSLAEQNYSANWFLGLVIAAGVFALLTWAVTSSLPASAAPAAPAITMKTIGYALMSDFVLPLEIVAVLLTVALIGAVIVAMPESPAKKDGGR
jgi:NADH-quinone oxidoreductase subunit J